MSNFKDFVKNSWHPEKEGTTLRGQVSGLMGRNKDSSRAADHVSRPLSDLRDPAAFAPPPRRTASALGPPSPQPKLPSPDDTPPSRPYRMDTTGLRTDHLPPPPIRSPAAAEYDAAPASRPTPPSLPPRLPPRGAGGRPPPASSVSSHSAADGYLNQGAVAKLGAAGVSVPGLGIGRDNPAGAPAPPSRPDAVGTNSSVARQSSHVDELQGMFSALGKLSGSSTPPPPSQGSTWAQKQAAVRTASALHKNPSSVSLSDAKAAAATANNFRQRHGDQVAAGVERTQNLNQKYGVMDKVGAYVNRENRSQAGQAKSEASGSAVMGSSLPAKKPPPPPPPKKLSVGGSSPHTVDGRNSGAPPPIPMDTRPAF